MNAIEALTVKDVKFATHLAREVIMQNVNTSNVPLYLDIASFFSHNFVFFIKPFEGFNGGYKLR